MCEWVIVRHVAGPCGPGKAARRTTDAAELCRETPCLFGRPHLHFVYTGRMASQDTTTVRVRRPDSERLQSLAKSRKTAVIDVVHEAIDALERQEFLRGLSDDYRKLREDPDKWQAFVGERQEWDSIS